MSNRQFIPAELIARPQWVVWKWETRDGKPTKVPYQPGNGARAESDNPNTWGRYEAAVQTFDRSQGNGQAYSGIGFVVTADDPFVGIDLDKCFDPDTGQSEDWAREILSEFDTYTEITPSGRGFRVWTKGTLPPEGRKKGHLEMYSRGRYFTVTGDRLPHKPAEIRDCQSALETLHARTFPKSEKTTTPPPRPASELSLSDTELLDKAFAARHGAEFQDLWNGNTRAYNGDHSAADLALCSRLLFWTGGDAARADQLFRQSGLMRSKWDKRHSADGRTYGALTMSKAASTVTDFYEGRPRQGSARHEPSEQESPPEIESITLPTVSPCTHLANSHRIRHYYQGQIRYALGLGWIMWTGKFWRADPTSEGSIATGFVSGLSRLIARESSVIARRAANEADEDRRKSLMAQAEARLKWAVQSENERVIEAGLKLSKYALLIEYSDLNADPWLFNVQNGTIDLRTGRIRPHAQSDLITFLSPVTYDPTATCPTWERFLSEVFAGDAEMVAFIQRAVGWSLTGVVKERALFFLYGDTGKNGKTTLVETLMKLVGDCTESSYGYGRKVGADTFMKSKNHEDNQRKAATLAGPRFICTSEVDEEHRLNEQLIKDITGGDTIEGRRLYQEAFTFKPQFKPWMYGNHKPEIRGTDEAMWSRVRLVPFEVSFKGREDLDLADKLEADLSGILNWGIRGCLDWQRNGLQPPAKVQAATQAYREEMDVFGPFIREHCVIHRNAEVWANDLFRAYKAWCAENGMREQSQHKLGRYLTAKGYRAENLGGRVKRLGIGLLPHHEDYDDYDLIPETPLIDTPYSDFLEKGHKCHKGHEEKADETQAGAACTACVHAIKTQYDNLSCAMTGHLIKRPHAPPCEGEKFTPRNLT